MVAVGPVVLVNAGSQRLGLLGYLLCVHLRVLSAKLLKLLRLNRDLNPSAPKRFLSRRGPGESPGGPAAPWTRLAGGGYAMWFVGLVLHPSKDLRRRT